MCHLLSFRLLALHFVLMNDVVTELVTLPATFLAVPPWWDNGLRGWVTPRVFQMPTLDNVPKPPEKPVTLVWV